MNVTEKQEGRGGGQWKVRTSTPFLTARQSAKKERVQEEGIVRNIKSARRKDSEREKDGVTKSE